MVAREKCDSLERTFGPPRAADFDSVDDSIEVTHLLNLHAMFELNVAAQSSVVAYRHRFDVARLLHV